MRSCCSVSFLLFLREPPPAAASRGDFWFLVSPQVSRSPPSARAGCAASGPLALLAYRRPAVAAAVPVATRQEISEAAGQDILASARRYVTRSSERAAFQQATAP